MTPVLICYLHHLSPLSETMWLYISGQDKGTALLSTCTLHSRSEALHLSAPNVPQQKTHPVRPIIWLPVTLDPLSLTPAELEHAKFLNASFAIRSIHMRFAVSLKSTLLFLAFFFELMILFLSSLFF